MNMARALCPVELEIAVDAGDDFRIRGTANTGGVMSSGRLFHPAAFAHWLASKPTLRTKVLANHGLVRGPGGEFVGVPGFNTIGRVTSLRMDGPHLKFEAKLAHGTQLADDARTLIRQGMLDGVSVGAMGPHLKDVRRGGRDVDAWVAAAMERSSLERVAVLDTVTDVPEISLVDVGDDPGARLAASYSDETLHTALEPITTQLRGLLEQVAALQDRPAQLSDEQFHSLLIDVEARQDARMIGDYGEALLDAETDAAACTHAAHAAREAGAETISDADIAAALQLVRHWDAQRKAS